MTLKEQVKNIVKDSEKKREQEKREKEKALIRSDEDWKVIDEYLENLLKELANEPLLKFGFVFGKYIKIDCTCFSQIRFPKNSKNEFIYLKDGTRLEITHEDMKRFCKQHKLKLRYLIEGRYDYERLFSNKYVEYRKTKAYLVKV